MVISILNQPDYQQYTKNVSNVSQQTDPGSTINYAITSHLRSCAIVLETQLYLQVQVSSSIK